MSSTTGPYFVDTNVLVYAEDASEPGERERARELIRQAMRSGLGTISTQVLVELYTVATRKLGLPPAGVRRRIEIYGSLRLHRPSLDDVLAAVDLSRLHGLAIWDALVVRSAQAMGCTVLYTEDLQAGRRFDGVEIVNPFS